MKKIKTDVLIVGTGASGLFEPFTFLWTGKC